MKVLNGILSVVLGIVSLVCMFKAQTTVQLGVGFGILLTSMLFMCFMLLEENKEEIERLRQIILKGK